MTAVFSPSDRAQCWANLPGGAALAVDLPLPPHHENTLFTNEQRRTIAAFGACLGADGFEVTITVPARTLERMPEGVFTVTNFVGRFEDGEVKRGGHCFLHPSGKIAPFYSPVL